MDWRSALNGDPLPWLLEPETPGVPYLALRDLLDCPAGDPELRAACASAHREGPIAQILAEMNPAGFWMRPGPGYNPKYRSIDWSLILLAQLGASIEADERISVACEYILEHGLAPGGQFSSNDAPSGTVDCLQGNLCWALTEMGCTDPRLEQAYEWMARTVTGEGIAPASDRRAPVRYYAYKSGPLFACGVNANQPCGWGGVKVMLAFSRLPQEQRTPLIEAAIRRGAEFMLGIDPASAAYPTRTGSKPNTSWWKFGFPVFYITDILQNVEALVRLGYGADPRLGKALALIRARQDQQGRWPLEYDYAGKTWVDFGPKRQPNKWVTLRALRVLKTANRVAEAI